MLVSVRIGSKCFVATSTANRHDYNELQMQTFEFRMYLKQQQHCAAISIK